MSGLADDVGRAVLAAARVDSADSLDVDDHLALIAVSAQAEEEVRGILQRSVAAARAGGASWALIGAELGMSRQAAQQRFGAVVATAGESERWLGPVTAFDELAELEIAGRAGWHTVEAGMLSHRMVRTDTQWEHRRILWRGSLAAEEAQGWQVGCRAFPWIYLIRDLGTPAETTPI
ncbi:hypothetical protein Q9R08_18190 [Microbacterium sp. QXD-8]|jgi:hypothetical protein|uniref:Uncharacterized protein n=1 Tax=Microbacterium psychrotolerans TaxID=3068321 RepID=A0ABU0Z5Q6_9MICO|nr:hypothetical protein [Microbacterium sp. QXD-8]MDQ7879925.1 hypothetical protein [Microbacterium sp. QXD-8]